MKFFLAVLRVWKFALQNIWRNVWLSFVTLTIFTLTLVTVNVVLFMNVLADTALTSIEQKVEVTVYFEPDTSEDLVRSAQGYVQGLTQVRETRYISAEEALTSFRERHSADAVILSSLDEVGENPFGPSIVISAQTSEDFDFILEAIETPEYAPHIKQKDFDDHRQTIENIKAWSERIRLVGLILAVFFGFIAVSIIFNTVRVAIYVHRDEISIMKLVGANDWFVRGPFLLEAGIYSLLATVIVTAGTFGVLQAIEPRIAFYFGDSGVGLLDYFTTYGVVIFGAQFIGIVLLSLVTTVVAMRRYLRV